MSLLSDRTLKHEIEIGNLYVGPYASEPQTASIEMHLGNGFWVYKRFGFGAVDPFADNTDKFTNVQHEDPFMISPGEFMLGHTIETVQLGRSLAARVDGKSSLGRLGLQVHCTAGFIDPGFKGQITLELYNQAPFPIVLRPLMPIGQLVCERTTGPVERPYGDERLGSHYQGSVGAVLPRAVEWSRLFPAQGGVSSGKTKP